MIYITGDTHREFYRLHNIEQNKDNILIILGDAGINYYLNDEDIINCVNNQIDEFFNKKL